MKTKSTYMLSIFTLLLAAFSGPFTAPHIAVSSTPGASSPKYITADFSPVLASPSTSTSSLNTATGTTNATSTSTSGSDATSSASYSPQPNDKYLKVGGVTLDLKGSSLLLSKTIPEKATLELKGYLPDPCHYLRVVVKGPNSLNQINVSVYSVYNPTLGCIAVIKPFSVSVSLGTFTSGKFSVFINGQFFSEFSVTPTITTVK